MAALAGVLSLPASGALAVPLALHLANLASAADPAACSTNGSVLLRATTGAGADLAKLAPTAGSTACWASGHVLPHATHKAVLATSAVRLS
eukprot:917167-Alexandrium_andersonii.AAC.1